MWAWALIPVVLASGGIVSTWVVCGIAVSNNSLNLTSRIPFISECANSQPQSSLFCFICHVWTLLIISVVVIRYQQVRDLGDRCRHANRAALASGFIAATGVSLLGSFPLKVFMVVHLLGAYLAFFVGLFYFWLQLWLTLRAQPSRHRRWMVPCRAVLCGLSTLLLLGMFFLKALGLRSPAVVSEWAMIMIFFLLFGTFAAEFRHIDCFRLQVQKRNFVWRNEEAEAEA